MAFHQHRHHGRVVPYHNNPPGPRTYRPLHTPHHRPQLQEEDVLLPRPHTPPAKRFSLMCRHHDKPNPQGTRPSTPPCRTHPPQTGAIWAHATRPAPAARARIPPGHASHQPTAAPGRPNPASRQRSPSPVHAPTPSCPAGRKTCPPWRSFQHVNAPMTTGRNTGNRLCRHAKKCAILSEMLSKSCWRERAGETCRKQKNIRFCTLTHTYPQLLHKYQHLRTLTHVYTHLRTTEQNWPELSTITPQLHHNYSTITPQLQHNYTTITAAQNGT